jgi:hypothetical protein
VRPRAATSPYAPVVDYLFLTTLDEIPALLRWVDSCVEDGFMTRETAADWRARIEEWRRWLEQQQAS